MKRSWKNIAWIVASLALGTLANVALAGGPGRSVGHSGGNKGGGHGGGHSPQVARIAHAGPKISTHKLGAGTTSASHALSSSIGNLSQRTAGGPAPKPLNFPAASGFKTKIATGIVPPSASSPIAGSFKPFKPMLPPVAPPIGGCFPPSPPHHSHCGPHWLPALAFGLGVGYGGYGYGGYGYGCPPVVVGSASPVVIENDDTIIVNSSAPVVVDAAAASDASSVGAVGGPGAPVGGAEGAAAARMRVQVGGEVKLENPNFGEKPGQVVLQLEQIALPLPIREWKDGKLVALVPPVGLAGPTKADLFVVRADGQVATSVPVELTAPQPPAEAPAADAQP